MPCYVAPLADRWLPMAEASRRLAPRTKWRFYIMGQPEAGLAARWPIGLLMGGRRATTASAPLGASRIFLLRGFRCKELHSRFL